MAAVKYSRQNVELRGRIVEQGFATSPGDVETIVVVIFALKFRHLDMLVVN
jgi:hypothetical protein